MGVFRVAVLQVDREIKYDRLSLEAQVRYYEYLQGNIDVETRAIDQKIDVLLKERDRKVKQFERAPQTIKELKVRLQGFGIRRNKLLVEPRKEQLKRLRRQLAALEINM